MRKLLAIGTLALLAVGCSSSLDKQLGYNDCTFPDSPGDKAPAWICEKPVDGIRIQAVGYSRELASGPGLMKDVAAAEARAYLASNFSLDVMSKLSRMASDEMTSDSVTAFDSIENITENLTSMTLKSSRIYSTEVSPAGGLYVLVGMDEAGYEENVEALAKASRFNL